MASRKPLVIASGLIEQLQSGDTLVDAAGTGTFVTQAAAFGTDDVLVATNGVTNGVKATTIDKDNVVTATSAFGVDNSVIRADGTGKGVQTSSIIITDTGNIALGSGWLSGDGGAEGVQVNSSGNTVIKAANNSAILQVLDSTGTVSGFEVNAIAGSSAIMIGVNAGLNSLPNSGSILIGADAGNLLNDTAGIISNIGIGNSALRESNVSGDIAIGASANAYCTGYGNYNNLAFGTAAGNSLSGPCASNIALGTQAGTGFQNSSGNFALGYASGINLYAANDNICIGTSAGQNISNAIDNISIGRGSSSSLSGDNNIVIGPGAGASITGSNNTVIGSNVSPPDPTADNQLNIMDYILINAAAEVFLTGVNLPTTNPGIPGQLYRDVLGNLKISL